MRKGKKKQRSMSAVLACAIAAIDGIRAVNLQLPLRVYCGLIARNQRVLRMKRQRQQLLEFLGTRRVGTRCMTWAIHF